MPFELRTINNKTHLVVSEPLARNTHIRITLDDGQTITASYKGGRIGGTPLASPLSGTLPAAERHLMSSHKNALKMLFAAILKDIQHCNEMLDELRDASDTESIARTADCMQTQAEKRQRLTAIVKLQQTPPVLNNVVIGEPLFMLLLSEENHWEVHELGTVAEICLSK